MKLTQNKYLPKIAIVGKPNAGKSSLFNAFVKRRKAIVEKTSGVTRDKLYADVQIGSNKVMLIDTGGMVEKPDDKIGSLVYGKSNEAIKESDAVMLVCDVITGLTYQDEHIADIIKRSKKRVFLVINKVDNKNLDSDVFDFYKLGLGTPHAVSVKQKRYDENFNQSLHNFLSSLKICSKKETSISDITKIAIVGRPNVGKSSFVNCILNEERLIVDDSPGTTRDSIDVYIKRDNRHMVLIDTAGMRHKKRLKEVVEIFSMARAKESIRKADAVIVIIDVNTGLCKDDILVLNYVIEQGKALIILVNKIDLIEKLDTKDYIEELKYKHSDLMWIPILFTSILDKKNIIRAIDIISEAVKRSRALIQTSKLNNLIERLQEFRPHPIKGRKRPKIFYSTQIEISPPKFVLFVAEPADISKNYLRYIEKNFRKTFHLEGVPIRFELRKR